MGIRSDVGLCVKRNPWDSLTVSQRESIQQVMRWANVSREHSQGYLFAWESVKWYHTDYDEIKALYRVLDELEPKDFILICSTPEYPEDNDADRGDWWDNPWDLRKIVDVRLEFDTQPTETTEV